MKKIITLAIVAITLCGIPAIAQTQNNGNCCNSTECCKQGAFAGITLNESQQKAISELNASRKAQKESHMQQMKKARKERLQNDSVARVERKNERREYLNKMKGILTPEQYVTYLENIVLVEQPQGVHPGKKEFRQGRMDNRMERRTGSGFAKDQRPQRGAKVKAPLNESK